MQMVGLGRTGLRVSQVCLGTMTFGTQADRGAANKIMDVAADRGVNFIDTANSYPMPPVVETAGRTEEMVGAWLKGKRERFVLATKVNNQVGPGPNDGGGSRVHLMRAIDDSLRRLQTDYVDIYYLHHPPADLSLEESLGVLDDLRRAGKIRYAAVSNVAAWALVRSLCWSEQRDRARFECVQPRYNMLYRAIEKELVPAAIANQVALVVYNPLAGGLLTGRYKTGEKPSVGRFAITGTSGERYRTRYYQDEMIRAVQGLAQKVAARDKSITQVALRWAMEQPGITSVIVGASKPEQLSDSLGAVNLTLDEADRQDCNAVWYEIPRRPQEDQ